jgi:predicted phosphoadenosine phosphosulfate sulfurtransferase
MTFNSDTYNFNSDNYNLNLVLNTIYNLTINAGHNTARISDITQETGIRGQELLTILQLAVWHKLLQPFSPGIVIAPGGTAGVTLTSTGIFYVSNLND